MSSLGGITPRDPRGNNSQHVDGGSIQPHEDTIEDLPQAQELQNLLWLGGHVTDTTNTDDEGNLGFWFHKVMPKCFGKSPLILQHGLLCIEKPAVPIIPPHHFLPLVNGLLLGCLLPSNSGLLNLLLISQNPLLPFWWWDSCHTRHLPEPSEETFVSLLENRMVFY